MKRLAFMTAGGGSAGKFVALLLGLTVLAAPIAAYAQALGGQVGYARVYTLDVGVSGEVAAVSVAVGDRVKAGTLLLSMDDGELTSELDAAAANMAWRQALQEEAERAWERDNELYAEGSLSQVELELRNIARLEAVADFRQSAAIHARADSRLKRSRIHAPASGVILEVNTHAGDRVNLVADSGPLLVMGSAELVARAVAAGDGAVVPSVGQAVEIAAGDRVINARVSSVLPAGDGESMLVTATAEGLLPPPGSAVEIRF